jgi:hypothetical protein
MANEQQNQEALYTRLTAALTALENPSGAGRLANLESVVSALARIQLGWWTSAPPVPQVVADPGGIPAQTVVLSNPAQVSAVATNIAAAAFMAVSDPNLRQVVDMRGYSKFRIQGRLGGALVSACKIRIQYHLGGDPNVGTADAGWQTLGESAGNHTLNAMFLTPEITVPAAARVNNLVLRAGLFGGNGVVDPTITCCILNLYG